MTDSPRGGLPGLANRHWTAIAQRWELVGPPLRPSPADTSAYALDVGAWAREHGAPRALILGVTPELWSLPWPERSRVRAVDHTRGMIESVWPGPRSAVVCGDWTALPFRDASHDVALCDGGLHLVTHPAGQMRLAESLRRVVAPRGLVILRLFAPPATRESPDAVLADLRAERIRDMNTLKLRLAMALQEDATRGVALARVWDVLRRSVPDLAHLADLLGRSVEHVRAIEAYRDSPAAYHFAGLDAVRRMFCGSAGGFDETAVRFPSYPLGERCPMLVLRRAA